MNMRFRKVRGHRVQAIGTGADRQLIVLYGFLSLVAALTPAGLGCGASHRVAVSDSDASAPPSDGGLPLPDAALPESDGQVPDRDPDAGVGERDPDSGAPEIDASLPDGAGLVFVRRRGFARSLHVLDLTDLTSERQLDPDTERTVSRTDPIGYSPDGLRLLLMERRPEETRLYVSYRCREVSCSDEAERFHLLLSLPGTSAGVPGPISGAPVFSPDGRAAAIPLYGSSGGLYYLPLGDSAPGKAIRLSEQTNTPYFVAAGRGLLVRASSEGHPLQLVDLAPDTGDMPVVHALMRSDGSAVMDIDSVSPDGAHFLADHHAFRALDVLTGQPQGRALQASTSPHATRDWIVVNRSSIQLQRWDGSETFTLPDTEGAAHLTCEDRLILRRAGSSVLSSVRIPSTTSPELPLTELPLTGVALGQVRFTDDCRRMLVRASGGRNMLADLEDGRVIESSTLSEGRLNRDGSLVQGGRFGLQSVWRVDTLNDAEPTGFVPRSMLRGTSVFANQDDFVVSSAPMEQALEPGLFRVEVRDGAPSVLTRLRAEVFDATELVLSQDDRYLAYHAENPAVPLTPEQRVDGVWETDLETGLSVRIPAPSDVVVGGVDHFKRVPGSHTLLITGRYGSGHAPVIALVDLSTGAFIPQLPEEALPRVVSDYFLSQDQVLTSAGDLLWYRGISAEGHGYWAQPLRFSHDAPLAPAQRWLENPPNAQSLETPVLFTVGHAQNIGVIYYRVQFGWSATTDARRLYRFDTQTGQESLLFDAGEGGRVTVVDVGARGGRVVLMQEQDSGARLWLLTSEAPSMPQLIAEGINEKTTGVSPDERWLVYRKQEGVTSTGHLFDLQTRVDHVLSHPSLQGVSKDTLLFQEGGPRALVIAGDTLWRLDLARLDSPTLLADGVRSDRNTVKFDSRVDRVVFRSRADTLIVAGPEGLRTLPLVADARVQFNLSPSGRFLLARETQEQTFQLWDLTRAELAPRELREGTHASVSFDSTGTLIAGKTASSSAPHSLTLWRVNQPDVPYHIAGPGEVVGDPTWLH